MKGTVADFDGHVGLGMIRAEDGRQFGFHCTQIGGGTRSIEVGTAVRFVIVAGQLGRWEAAGVESEAAS